MLIALSYICTGLLISPVHRVMPEVWKIQLARLILNQKKKQTLFMMVEVTSM
jgi:hypothetical protein